jgi:hypothetical protein
MKFVSVYCFFFAAVCSFENCRAQTQPPYVDEDAPNGVCVKEKPKDCATVPSPGVPCADQHCRTWTENGVDVYACNENDGNGKIGYYDIALTYPTTVPRASDAEPGSDKVRKWRSWYCWIQKGCPKTTCSDWTTSDTDPSQSVRYCVEPSHSGTKCGIVTDAQEPTGTACTVKPQTAVDTN